MHIPSLAELEELGLVSPETVEEVKQMPQIQLRQSQHFSPLKRIEKRVKFDVLVKKILLPFFQIHSRILRKG